MKIVKSMLVFSWFQVYLHNGNPGEEREIILQGFTRRHRAVNAHCVYTNSGPRLFPVRTHLQETKVSTVDGYR